MRFCRKDIAVIFCTMMYVIIAWTQPVVEHRILESVKNMFGDSITVDARALALSLKEKQTIREQTKTQWRSDTVTVLLCTSHGKPVGYGFVDDVKGKMNFITYLVGISINGSVQDVDVLAYRESYGGEITYESFRKQFRQKSATDKLQPGRDIKNISGATVSVHAITGGIRRILTTYELIKSRIQ